MPIKEPRQGAVIVPWSPRAGARVPETAMSELETIPPQAAAARTPARLYDELHRTIPLGFEPGEDVVTARVEDGVPSMEVREPPRAAGAVRRTEIA
jgi:hypothetical protein